MKLFAAIVFLFSIVCASAHLIDYRLKTTAASTPKDCTSPGPLCETCESLVGCVANDDGWTKNHLATCKSPAFCVGGVCTTDYDPVCNGDALLDFPCQAVGIFPDPFFCNKFVLCVHDTPKTYKHYLNTCEEGYGYNVATDLCDIKLENGQCKDREYPLPLCEEPGQSGALDGKPAMYYLCEQYSKKHTVLYPFLNICPGGESYENYTCGNGGTESTTPGRRF